VRVPKPEDDAEAQAARPQPRCPECGAENAEVISLFGTHAMLLQYRCHACGHYFEASKY
jgi:uncharacterized Zn finger protein